MNNTLQDYKNLLLENGALNYKAEAGQSYKEMYEHSGYLDWLISLCKKYDIEFDKNKIEWEWENYIQNKTWELEKKLEKLLMQLNTEKTFTELLYEDKKYLRNIFKKNKDLIKWDEEYYGWFMDDEPIIDYLYKDENTILNPKELNEVIEEIIENELLIKRKTCDVCNSFDGNVCVEIRSSQYKKIPFETCKYWENWEVL